jgi:predicted nucleotidyltransferase
MVDRSAISSFCDAVVREFQPRKVILFGSHAAGIPTAESDVDLLVVMHHWSGNLRMALEILGTVKPDFAVDLLVRTPAELRQRIRHNDWFLRDISEKGLVLYEAPDA